MLGRFWWVLVARSSARVVSDHVAELRGAWGHEASEVAARAMPEVPTHLACISYLAVLYFSAYLAIFIARSGERCVERCLAGHRVEEQPAKPEGEGRLAKATEALVFVPALCTLFLATRVWTLATARHDGDVVQVIQTTLGAVMYAIVACVLVEYLVKALTHEGSRGCGAVAIAVAQAGVLAGAVFILVAIFTSPVRPSDATLGCATLLSCFFGVHVLLSIADAMAGCLGEQDDAQKLEWHAKAQDVRATLALFPMLCVLLVSLRMRALELGADLVGATHTISVLVAASLLKVAAVGLRSSACGGACTGVVLVGLESLMMVAVYGAASLLVLLLLLLEEDPAAAYAVDLQPSFLQTILHAEPVPTSMKCVTMLSVLFFLVYLSILLSHMLQYVHEKLVGRAQYTTRKVEQTRRSAEDAVLFVPMLAVLMIALRLRARTYYEADPPEWAQIAMYACVASLTLQVLLAPLVVAAHDVFKDENEAADWSKYAALGFLVLHYLAGKVTFFCGVATLVVAVWHH